MVGRGKDSVCDNKTFKYCFVKQLLQPSKWREEPRVVRRPSEQSIKKTSLA